MQAVHGWGAHMCVFEWGGESMHVRVHVPKYACFYTGMHDSR